MLCNNGYSALLKCKVLVRLVVDHVAQASLLYPFTWCNSVTLRQFMPIFQCVPDLQIKNKIKIENFEIV